MQRHGPEVMQFPLSRPMLRSRQPSRPTLHPIIHVNGTHISHTYHTTTYPKQAYVERGRHTTEDHREVQHNANSRFYDNATFHSEMADTRVQKELRDGPPVNLDVVGKVLKDSLAEVAGALFVSEAPGLLGSVLHVGTRWALYHHTTKRRAALLKRMRTWWRTSSTGGLRWSRKCKLRPGSKRGRNQKHRKPGSRRERTSSVWQQTTRREAVGQGSNVDSTRTTGARLHGPSSSKAIQAVRARRTEGCLQSRCVHGNRVKRRGCQRQFPYDFDARRSLEA